MSSYIKSQFNKLYAVKDPNATTRIQLSRGSKKTNYINVSDATLLRIQMILEEGE